jgi:hypothetical protein
MDIYSADSNHQEEFNNLLEVSILLIYYRFLAPAAIGRGLEAAAYRWLPQSQR